MDADDRQTRFTDPAPVIEAARTWWLLRSLRASSRRSPRALARIQARQLRSALDHAYQRVPFYRRVWDEAGFDPGSVRRTEDIERVPIVTQPAVREAVARGELLADDVDTARTARYTTSGTTGEPMPVLRGTLEQRLIRAGGLRIWFEHGYRWRYAPAQFDYESGPHHRLRRFGASRTSWISARSGTDEQLAALRAARPDLVVGTPTVLRRVCGAIEAEGAGDVTPQIVFCGGEVLDAATRALIERALRVAPVEYYGPTEVGYVAWQCERREGLHVNAETSLAEVRRDGRAARTGELGTLVLTDLRGRTMPLIRYDSGDLAVAEASPCPCGRSLPLLRSTQGRARCAVTLADDRVLGMRTIVDHLADALPPERYRLHQETETRFRLQLDSGASDPQGVMRRLSQLLGESEIRLEGDLPAPPKDTLKTDPVSSAISRDLA